MTPSHVPRDEPNCLQCWDTGCIKTPPVLPKGVILTGTPAERFEQYKRNCLPVETFACPKCPQGAIVHLVGKVPIFSPETSGI